VIGRVQMQPAKKKHWITIVAGIWLLAVGSFLLLYLVIVVGQIVRGVFDFFTGISAIMSIPGILCFLAGIWTLKRIHWRLTFWFSAVSILFTLGLTIPPTIILAWAEKEYS
jgi:hypothetical protein